MKLSPPLVFLGNVCLISCVHSAIIEADLVREIQAPIIADGHQIGSVDLPKGSTLTIISVAADEVTVSRGGAEPFKIPSDDFSPESIAAAMATPTPRPSVTPFTPAPTPRPTPVDTPSPSPSVDDSPLFFDQIKDMLTTTYTGKSPHYTAIYFSGHWCPGCREFTPQLVRWYNSFKGSHPDFELVFFSEDETAKDMDDYIKSDSMPWPALSFYRKGDGRLRKYYPQAIPSLVLIDKDGNAITELPGNKYVAPSSVLQKIQDIVPLAN